MPPVVGDMTLDGTDYLPVFPWLDLQDGSISKTATSILDLQSG